MALDPAIASVLGVDAAHCTVSAHGGSGFSSTSRIDVVVPESTMPGQPARSYFLKIGGGGDAAETMFRGEHLSLNAIHDVVPSLSTASFGTGRLDDRPDSSFLVTEFLHPAGGGARQRAHGGNDGSGMSLAQKLAKLHTTPAPIPPGHDRPMFGFPATTCCGETPQENNFTASWADFYAERRLRAIGRRIKQTQGSKGRSVARVHNLIERAATVVVPRLLREGYLGGEDGIVPVVVHGDLWSGNATRGRIGDQGSHVEDVTFDPSSCYAHSEYELGIMKMFGGFSTMLPEYHQLVPKTEPANEYPDRVALYEAYHHLNHFAMFGGGYGEGAITILDRLVRKYE